MYCHHCNREITASGDVCPECGTPRELCTGNDRDPPATDTRLKNLLEEVTRRLDETFAQPGVALDAAEARALQGDTPSGAEQAAEEEAIFEAFKLEKAGKTRATPGAPQTAPVSQTGACPSQPLGRGRAGTGSRGRTVALWAGVAVMFCFGAALQSSGLLTRALHIATKGRATIPPRAAPDHEAGPSMPGRIPVPVATEPRPAPPPGQEIACYAVHTDSYRSLRSAEREAAALKNQGFAAYLDSADVPESGRWFRVKVGPFATAAEARIAMDSLQARAGKNDSLIVPERFREPAAGNRSPDPAL